ncbi:MAG TPA: ABC transporter permease [Actinomycetota bacterium]|nr:ABC transporter permease [Actinomycetota bacterium]
MTTVDEVVVEAPPPGGSAGPRRSIGARRRLVPYYLLSPGALFLLLFFLIPLGLMLYTSLESGGLLSGGFRFSWAFDNYTNVLGQYQVQFVRSIVYSIIVTIAALLLAYPMTYWIAFYGGKWKSSLLLLILVPFFVSFVIRTIQWKFILGDHGPILGPLKDIGLLPQGFRVLATPFAVVAGITYNFLPFTALPLYVALERIDKRLVEAAKDLYSSRWEAFRKVVWPLSLPGVFAAFLLTFVPATGDYVNATLLGGPGTTMIGNIIQEKFLVELDYPEAAALSVILMIVMLVLATIYARILGTEDVQRAAGAGA